MLRKKISILFIIIVVFMLFTTSVNAKESEDKVIDICVGVDDSNSIDRFLYNALKNMGYKVNITSLKMTSAIISVDCGELDMLGIQGDDLEATYYNLIRVPTEITKIRFVVYANEESNIGEVNTWSDLKGYNLGHEFQRPHIEKMLKQIGQNAYRGKSKTELLELVQKNQLDLVIIPQTLNYHVWVPKGVKVIGEIDLQPVYSYVNKDLAYIIPDLTEELNKLKQNGIGDIILSNQSINVSNDKRKIFLHISSYSGELDAEDKLISGINNKILENNEYEIYNLNLNTSKIELEDNRYEAYADLLRTDFIERSPDVIIASDVSALKFLQRYYYVQFQNIPVVYYGIGDNIEEEKYGFEDYFVGIGEEIPIEDTIETMLEMFPNTKNLYILNDYFEDGRLWKDKIENYLLPYSNILNIEYNEDESIMHLAKKLSDLSKDTLVLSGNYLIDTENRYYSEKEVLKFLSDNCNVPMFGLNPSTFGYGEIGGKYINKYNEGQYIGEIAVRLSEGQQIENIEIDIQKTLDSRMSTNWIFDYNALNRWNINEKKLPNGAEIVNKELSYFEENAVAFYLTVMVAFFGIMLIIGLVYFMMVLSKKNKKLLDAQKELYSAEEIIRKDDVIKKVKNRLEKIIESAPIVFILATKDGKIAETNKYAMECLDVFSGKYIQDYYFDINDRARILKKLDEDGIVTNEVVRLKIKDESANRFHINLANAEYEGEEATILWGMNIEMSEQQKDSYQRSQEDLQRIIDALPIPMIIMEPKNISLIYGNTSYLNLFGDYYKDDEKKYLIKAMPEFQPNGQSSLEFIENYLQGVYMSDEIIEEEVQHILPNGEIFDSKTVCTKMFYKGRPALTVIIQDISAEKKQAEMLKNTAQKEKEANQIKSQFIVNMSHEVRTPMNAIIGLSDVELLKEHDRKVYETFKKINISAKVLLSIVNDILDFSKMEAHKLDIIEEEFKLEEAISGALLMATQRLTKKRVEILLKMEKGLPEVVFNDKTRLWQVLKNILDNSAKFTDEGRIILSVSLSDEYKPEDKKIVWIKFEIADTGYGMSEDQLKRLFIPFEQFNQSSTRAAGTGLGMSITKQLTELMGGRIYVESKLNMGTKTTIILPFKVIKNSKTIEESIDVSGLVDKRILIADDDVYACEIMKELLDSINIKSEYVNKGSDVLAKVEEAFEKKQSYDVIILDYLMDDMTGIEVAKKLKDYNEINPKLLMVTAYTRHLIDEDIDIKEVGFVDLIDKPFIPSEFVKKICASLGIVNDNKKEILNAIFPEAKVLLAEDNVVNQEVAKGILSIYGINPKIANNGLEALEMLEVEEFDLVLMDILMPKMDGHTAAVEIRKSDKPFKNIPIVAMTANAMKDEIEKCREEGMNGHISKPVEFEKLYAELIKYLPHRMVIQEEALDEKSSDSFDELSLEEVNFFEGVARFGGNKEKYISTLLKFAKGLNENPLMPFEKAILEENFDTTKRLVHTLKGSAGNLSISTIYKSALEFEKTLIENNPDKELYLELINACKTANQKITSKLEIKSSEDVKEVGSFEERVALLEELSINLTKFDAQVCDSIVEKLKQKQWEGIDSQLLEKLYLMVEDYEYEDAMELIEKLS